MVWFAPVRITQCSVSKSGINLLFLLCLCSFKKNWSYCETIFWMQLYGFDWCATVHFLSCKYDFMIWCLLLWYIPVVYNDCSGIVEYFDGGSIPLTCSCTDGSAICIRFFTTHKRIHVKVELVITKCFSFNNSWLEFKLSSIWPSLTAQCLTRSKWVLVGISISISITQRSYCTYHCFG
jgi:hypothetical protein